MERLWLVWQTLRQAVARSEDLSSKALFLKVRGVRKRRVRKKREQRRRQEHSKRSKDSWQHLRNG
jgi:hypothetical protein